MSALSLFDEHPLRGVWGEFQGLRVLLVLQGDDVRAVDYASIGSALGGIMTDHLGAFLNRAKVKEIVEVDGVIGSRDVIPLAGFNKFCMMHPSDRLETFRDRLATIAERIQNRGSYIDTTRGPEAYIPSNLTGDQTAQMLAAMMHNLSETKRTQAEVVRLQGDVVDVQSQLAVVQDAMALRGSFMTVAAWFALHRVKPTDNKEISDGGTRVSRICRDRGWESNGEEMNGQFPAKKWPVEALRLWWKETGRQVKPGC